MEFGLFTFVLVLFASTDPYAHADAISYHETHVQCFQKINDLKEKAHPAYAKAIKENRLRCLPVDFD